MIGSYQISPKRTMFELIFLIFVLIFLHISNETSSATSILQASIPFLVQNSIISKIYLDVSLLCQLRRGILGVLPNVE
jgi:predicted transglutaminase-like protease